MSTAANGSPARKASSSTRMTATNAQTTPTATTTNSNNATAATNRGRHQVPAASPWPEDENVIQFEPAKTEEPPAEQGVPVERTTRFEPATLTLAR